MQHILYLASWTKVKFYNKLGQRGAEMVEYAVVLACIAVVALAYYHIQAWADQKHGYEGTTIKSALELLFRKVNDAIPK